jgi:CheY-like chemotaxis protein
MKGTIEAKISENGGLEIVICLPKRRIAWKRFDYRNDAAIAAIERDYLAIVHFEVEIALDGGKTVWKKPCKAVLILILLDLDASRHRGFTVCRRLMEELDIPFLMVTARRRTLIKYAGWGLEQMTISRSLFLQACW